MPKEQIIDLLFLCLFTPPLKRRLVPKHIALNAPVMWPLRVCKDIEEDIVLRHNDTRDLAGKGLVGMLSIIVGSWVYPLCF